MSSSPGERTDPAEMGALIKGIRRAAGMSQTELARRIGVSYQQVQKYEKGASNITVTRLARIARALEVQMDVFIGRGEAQRPLDHEEAKVLAAFRSLGAEEFRRAAVEVMGIIGRLGSDTH